VAELNLFHYRPGGGPIHRLDGRVKLLLLILTVLSIYTTEGLGLLIITLLLTSAALIVPLHLRHYHRETLVFGILALIIFVSAPDRSAGAVSAWRFLLVALSGMLFTAATSPDELHGAVFLLLRPLPRIAHGRIASHLALSLLFIPLLLDTAQEILLARRARLVGLSINPLRRISSLAFPLVDGLFTRVEETAMALEARSYDEEVLGGEMQMEKKDSIVSLIAVCLTLGGIILSHNS
jgi:energy-coupling factor transporter transmembrane protein EcfT